MKPNSAAGSRTDRIRHGHDPERHRDLLEQPVNNACLATARPDGSLQSNPSGSKGTAATYDSASQRGVRHRRVDGVPTEGWRDGDPAERFDRLGVSTSRRG